jgi:hypothetical protein
MTSTFIKQIRLPFSSDFPVSLSHDIGRAKQTYVYKDSLSNCYSRELKAANNVLNTVTDGAACRQH